MVGRKDRLDTRCISEFRGPPELVCGASGEYEPEELGGEAWLNGVGKTGPADAGERLRGIEDAFPFD